MGGLRFLLAAAVIMQHSSPMFLPKILPGTVAVEMFFIISGFYMSLILSGKYDARSPGAVWRFYASRFFRLWPVFILTTVAKLTLLAAASVYAGHVVTAGFMPIFEATGDAAVIAAILASNFVMIGQDVMCLFHVHLATGAALTFGPPGTLADGSPWMGFTLFIGPAWSIGAEIWFYLIAPFLIRKSTAALIALVLASLALRFIMQGAYGLNTYFFFPAQLAFFLAGMMAYRFREATSRIGLTDRWVALAGLGCLVASIVAFGRVDEANQHLKWLIFAEMVIFIYPIFSLTMHNKIDRIIGELSYPMYITHGLLITLVATALGRRASDGVSSEVIIAVVVFVSSALYWTVEAPVNRWRQRYAAAPVKGAAPTGAGPGGQDQQMCSAQTS